VYASNKAVQSDPAVQKLREAYRLMLAHCDHRSLTMSITFVVTHLVMPVVFGPV
jgi:hypothetical protein